METSSTSSTPRARCIWRSPARSAAAAAALGAVGAGLAVIYLRPPYSPAVLEPLADALSRVA